MWRVIEVAWCIVIVPIAALFVMGEVLHGVSYGRYMLEPLDKDEFGYEL